MKTEPDKTGWYWHLLEALGVLTLVGGVTAFVHTIAAEEQSPLTLAISAGLTVLGSVVALERRIQRLRRATVHHTLEGLEGLLPAKGDELPPRYKPALPLLRMLDQIAERANESSDDRKVHEAVKRLLAIEEPPNMKEVISTRLVIIRRHPGVAQTDPGAFYELFRALIVADLPKGKGNMVTVSNAAFWSAKHLGRAQEGREVSAYMDALLNCCEQGLSLERVCLVPSLESIESMLAILTRKTPTPDGPRRGQFDLAIRLLEHAIVDVLGMLSANLAARENSRPERFKLFVRECSREEYAGHEKGVGQDNSHGSDVFRSVRFSNNDYLRSMNFAVWSNGTEANSNALAVSYNAEFDGIRTAITSVALCPQAAESFRTTFQEQKGRAVKTSVETYYRGLLHLAPDIKVALNGVPRHSPLSVDIEKHRSLLKRLRNTKPA